MRSPARCFRARQRRRGVALIIVLLTLFTLGVMAGIFAYAMKVETRLAVNTSNGTEMEWLGRSGIEMAKWILVEQDKVASERGFSALNQFWAGGPGPIESADNPFADITLENMEIGQGRVSIQILDQERWVNINTAARNPGLLHLALSLTGADATDSELIATSIREWVSKGKNNTGFTDEKESYYLSLDPPYLPKSGPIDHINELLLVRGVTPSIFWGPQRRITTFGQSESYVPKFGLRNQDAGEQSAGLVEMFCALSNGRVNINTAPEAVLRLMVGGDASLAREILRQRAGTDGIDGTEDDQPARGAGEIGRLLGPVGPGSQASFVTQSSTYSVLVTVQLGTARETYRGLLRRAGRSFDLLLFRRE